MISEMRTKVLPSLDQSRDRRSIHLKLVFLRTVAEELSKALRTSVRTPIRTVGSGHKQTPPLSRIVNLVRRLGFWRVLGFSLSPKGAQREKDMNTTIGPFSPPFKADVVRPLACALPMECMYATSFPDA
jgi:hypothetical protein